MNTNVELSNKDLKALAPSIFAKEAWSGVSKRYAFIPTIDVVDALRDSGMVPVRATQSAARMPDKREFTKHMIRFRAKGDLTKFERKVVAGNAHHFYKRGEAPELMEAVLTNAHDLSALYAMDAGLYRQVCSNGLVVQSNSFGCIRIRHVGNVIEEVLKASREIAASLPKVLAQIKSWRSITLTPEQRNTFAMAALVQRYGVDEKHNLLAPVKPESLLVPRRPEDDGDSLWITMNVVQENMMKGELIGASATGRRVRTRAIKSVNTELDINRNLWSLAETMAEGVTA